MAILPAQRHLFDIPADVAYFNCAYNSPQLNESRRRLVESAASKSRPWTRTPASFFEDAETLRSLASALFGGDPGGYAVVPSASFGVSAAERVLEPRLRAGDAILLMAEEFPSNVLPWHRAAAHTGAVIRTVPTPADGDWTAAILEHLADPIRIVAVSTCHWTNGARVDLTPIARACRSADRWLVVDATQSLGAVPLSVDELQPDFLVTAGYKWLLCPYGVGLLYVAERWREERPLEETWLGREHAEDFASLVRYSHSYRQGARRFDVGETCTALLPGAIAALEQLRAWGVAQIADSLAALTTRLAAKLLTLGFRLPPERYRGSHILGALLPDGKSANAVDALRRRQIYISQRGSSLRFAPHLHVNAEDLARLFESLDELFV